MKKTHKETEETFNDFIQGEFPDEGADSTLQLLLAAYFPQPELIKGGGHYYTPEEIKYFDALFERFGLAFRSTDDKFDDIEYLPELWFRLSTDIGSYIFAKAAMPKIIDRCMNKMPPDFRDYILAVRANDVETMQRLARQLDIENLDAFCISGLFATPNY